MAMDTGRNVKFSRSMIVAPLAKHLHAAWSRTGRLGMSISDPDIEEIKAAHQQALTMVNNAFGRMTEAAETRQANLEAFGHIRFVSLGVDCFARTVLTRWGLKPPARLGEKSTPFDLSVHPLGSTIQLLETDFQGYTEPENLYYSKTLGYVCNRPYRVSFNHEKGAKYNEPGFTTVREIYDRRVGIFRATLANASELAFAIHITKPGPEKWPRIRQIWDLLKAAAPQANMTLTIFNTYPAGAEIDTSHRESVDIPGITILDAHYPRPGYVWHKHAGTAGGHTFERDLMARYVEVLEAQHKRPEAAPAKPDAELTAA